MSFIASTVPATTATRALSTPWLSAPACGFPGCSVEERTAFLENVSRSWSELPEADYPFTRRMAEWVRDHDDREDLLAGIDFIVLGATSATQRQQNVI
ncbi:MAG: hypothetical protein EON58_09610 [Alphaproteobacteria bacterium]|nr:MAG: hypothetical protein EON58_09610 [Alphaproteobacteria bacterium]